MPPLETRDKDPYWAARMTTPAQKLQDMRDESKRDGTGQAGIDQKIMAGVRGVMGALAKADAAEARANEAAAYALTGQGREAPRSTNGVARWAEGKVGSGGYRPLDGAPDAKGRRNEVLAPVPVVGSWMRGRFWDPKCNQFVWDALQAGGAPAGRLPDGRIPVAKEWGDRSSKIPGYSPVIGAPQPGDVVSNGHHVGIYAPLPGGRPGTISAAVPFSRDGGFDGQIVHNQWGFEKNSGPVTVWRASKR